MKLLFLYLILVNAVGFLLMTADKIKAKKNLWRIPEATLIGVAVVSGSLGVMIAMNLMRHKTKHPKFSIGVPMIFAIQVVFTLFLGVHL